MFNRFMGSALALIILATPNFGAVLSSQSRPFVAFGSDGAQIGFTSKSYELGLSFSTLGSDSYPKSTYTYLAAHASFKWAVEPSTFGKVGVRVSSLSGKESGDDYTASGFAITAGLQKELSDSILIDARVDVISVGKSSDVTVTGILSRGAVSASWLF